MDVDAPQVFEAKPALGRKPMRKNGRWRLFRRWKVAILVTLTALFVAFVYVYRSEVDNSLTSDDHRYIPEYLSDVPLLKSRRTFEDEVAFIRAVQRSVITMAQKPNGIAKGLTREPKDLFQLGQGLCYDKSRVIEKICRFGALQTRHVYVLYRDGNESFWRTILYGKRSHAMSEVLTAKGWMLVDSASGWVSVGKDGLPASAVDHQRALISGVPLPTSEVAPKGVVDVPFYVIYGLYSRHGRFYAPYNMVPDLSFSELAANF
jgi:transglutaminase-like putative cysteine protease